MFRSCVKGFALVAISLLFDIDNKKAYYTQLEKNSMKRILKFFISTCCIAQMSSLYRILLKTFLKIKCTVNMVIEEITSIKWLTMKWYEKLIDLIITCILRTCYN